MRGNKGQAQLDRVSLRLSRPGHSAFRPSRAQGPLPYLVFSLPEAKVGELSWRVEKCSCQGIAASPLVPLLYVQRGVFEGLHAARYSGVVLV